MTNDPMEIIKTLPDYAVFEKITDLTAKYVGKVKDRVDGYFLNPYPQRLCSLNESLKMWVLRESGDIKNFLAITEEINSLIGREPSAKDYHVIEMAQWLDKEIRKLPSSITQYPQDKERIVIGLMVWGEFVDKALDILFKSWLTAGNIESLCKNKIVIIHIITTANDASYIKKAPIIKQLEKVGAVFSYVNISVDLTRGSETYWLIGAGVALQLAYAKRMNASYRG